MIRISAEGQDKNWAETPVVAYRVSAAVEAASQG